MCICSHTRVFVDNNILNLGLPYARACLGFVLTGQRKLLDSSVFVKIAQTSWTWLYSFSDLWYRGYLNVVSGLRSALTLAQVVACFLMAPSHYLNQCWLIISEVQWQSPVCNLTIGKISLKFTYQKCNSNLLGDNGLILYFLYRSKDESHRKHIS